jgi:ABC-type multidrug transport system ATPase subunit
MTARNARPGGHPGTGTGSPREASTSAIEAVGLTKSFGSVRALDGFGLTVSRGSVCALLGPNGAGKTTAIRILATLTRPDAGRASVAGYDVARQPALVRRHIGLLTTQYLDEADRLADDVVIIDRGRMAAHGSPGQLKDAIGTRIDVVVEDVGDLLAAGVASRWATRPPVIDRDRRRLTIPVAAGSVTLPEVVRQLDAAGVRAEDVSVRRPSLDEVFLDRVGDGRARDGKEAVA